MTTFPPLSGKDDWADSLLRIVQGEHESGLFLHFPIQENDRFCNPEFSEFLLSSVASSPEISHGNRLITFQIGENNLFSAHAVHNRLVISSVLLCSDCGEDTQIETRSDLANHFFAKQANAKEVFLTSGPIREITFFESAKTTSDDSEAVPIIMCLHQSHVSFFTVTIQDEGFVVEEIGHPHHVASKITAFGFSDGKRKSTSGVVNGSGAPLPFCCAIAKDVAADDAEQPTKDVLRVLIFNGIGEDGSMDITTRSGDLPTSKCTAEGLTHVQPLPCIAGSGQVEILAANRYPDGATSFASIDRIVLRPNDQVDCERFYVLPEGHGSFTALNRCSVDPNYFVVAHKKLVLMLDSRVANNVALKWSIRLASDYDSVTRLSTSLFSCNGTQMGIVFVSLLSGSNLALPFVPSHSKRTPLPAGDPAFAGIALAGLTSSELRALGPNVRTSIAPAAGGEAMDTSSMDPHASIFSLSEPIQHMPPSKPTWDLPIHFPTFAPCNFFTSPDLPPRHSGTVSKKVFHFHSGLNLSGLVDLISLNQLDAESFMEWEKFDSVNSSKIPKSFREEVAKSGEIDKSEFFEVLKKVAEAEKRDLDSHLQWSLAMDELQIRMEDFSEETFGQSESPIVQEIAHHNTGCNRLTGLSFLSLATNSRKNKSKQITKNKNPLVTIEQIETSENGKVENVGAADGEQVEINAGVCLLFMATQFGEIFYHTFAFGKENLSGMAKKMNSGDADEDMEQGDSKDSEDHRISSGMIGSEKNLRYRSGSTLAKLNLFLDFGLNFGQDRTVGEIEANRKWVSHVCGIRGAAMCPDFFAIHSKNVKNKKTSRIPKRQIMDFNAEDFPALGLSDYAPIALSDLLATQLSSKEWQALLSVDALPYFIETYPTVPQLVEFINDQFESPSTFTSAKIIKFLAHILSQKPLPKATKSVAALTLPPELAPPNLRVIYRDTRDVVAQPGKIGNKEAVLGDFLNTGGEGGMKLEGEAAPTAQNPFEILVQQLSASGSRSAAAAAGSASTTDSLCIDPVSVVACMRHAPLKADKKRKASSVPRAVQAAQEELEADWEADLLARMQAPAEEASGDSVVSPGESSTAAVAALPAADEKEKKPKAATRKENNWVKIEVEAKWNVQDFLL